MKKKCRSKQIAIQKELHEFVINDALACSSKLRRLDRRVRSTQEALRRVINKDGWHAYLTLEEATNARARKQIRVVFQRMLDALAYAMFQLGSR